MPRTIAARFPKNQTFSCVHLELIFIIAFSLRQGFSLRKRQWYRRNFIFQCSTERALSKMTRVRWAKSRVADRYVASGQLFPITSELYWTTTWIINEDPSPYGCCDFAPEVPDLRTLLVRAAIANERNPKGHPRGEIEIGTIIVSCGSLHVTSGASFAFNFSSETEMIFF